MDPVVVVTSAETWHRLGIIDQNEQIGATGFVLMIFADSQWWDDHQRDPELL